MSSLRRKANFALEQLADWQPPRLRPHDLVPVTLVTMTLVIGNGWSKNREGTESMQGRQADDSATILAMRPYPKGWFLRDFRFRQEFRATLPSGQSASWGQIGQVLNVLSRTFEAIPSR